MIITYHGAGMVKVSQGEWLAVFNPISKESKFKPSRGGADLALVALQSPDYNGVDEATFGERAPFAIDGPGEYEVAGTFIHGFESVGPDDKINTIFDLALEGKRLVHLGALANAEIAADTKEALLPIDILFVPVGAPLLTPAAAYRLAIALNPRLIIPVNYTPESLKQFLKEAGEEGLKAVDKLVIKGKEIAEKEGEVLVLEAV
ncbi:MAG: MBL fold metallo-hydrolase [Patescibacteria group bacterium]